MARMNKTELLLREIQARDGMTFRECQKFLVELLYGPGKYDPRKHRGHYCGSILCGCKRYDGTPRPKAAGPGSVLDKWCDRGPDRKYRIRPGLVLKAPYHPIAWPSERYTRMVQAACKHQFRPYGPGAGNICERCQMWEVDYLA